MSGRSPPIYFGARGSPENIGTVSIPLVQFSETKVSGERLPTLARAIGHHVKVFLEVLNEKFPSDVDELSAG